VDAKRMPAWDDAAVRHRAEERALTGAIAREVNARVKWLEQP
jgi:hypothetical protein